MLSHVFGGHKAIVFAKLFEVVSGIEILFFYFLSVDSKSV